MDPQDPWKDTCKVQQADKQSAKGHVPMRMCISCRARAPKHRMRRFVRDPEQGLAADVMQRMPGRGLYVCDNPTCLELLTTGKRRKRPKGVIHGQ